jgi:nicotinamide mononucleotide transporter
MIQFVGYVFEIDWLKILNYFSNSYLELAATIFGFIYIFYSIKGDIKLWIFGLLSSGLFAWVFFKSKVYADMGIQIYYVTISIYGWIHWYLYRDRKKQKIPIKNLTGIQWIYTIVAIVFLFGVIGVFLDLFTDSDIPYWDAFTTATSIIATLMLARKIIEQWLLWIVADFVSVILYLHKDLYYTVVLMAFYTVLAVIGYFEWRKKLKYQTSKLS